MAWYGTERHSMICHQLPHQAHQRRDMTTNWWRNGKNVAPSSGKRGQATVVGRLHCAHHRDTEAAQVNRRAKQQHQQRLGAHSCVPRRHDCAHRILHRRRGRGKPPPKGDFNLATSPAGLHADSLPPDRLLAC